MVFILMMDGRFPKSTDGNVWHILSLPASPLQMPILTMASGSAIALICHVSATSCSGSASAFATFASSISCDIF